MGPEEANQLRIALSSLSTFTAFQFFNDPTAMRGYHNAYFGFKGDEDGNDWISRPGMRAERLAFLADIRRKYGIEFELDMPIDWDLLRAISGAESPF